MSKIKIKDSAGTTHWLYREDILEVGTSGIKGSTLKLSDGSLLHSDESMYEVCGKINSVKPINIDWEQRTFDVASEYYNAHNWKHGTTPEEAAERAFGFVERYKEKLKELI